jgi:biotin carboxyl carrier protein
VTFDVEVRGRRHRVEVVRTADGDHVSIDGRMFASHVDGTSPFWSLLIDQNEGSGVARSYEVAFDADGASGTLAVSVDGAIVPVRLVDRRRGRARAGVAAAPADMQEVRAPMPGRIVRVLVAAGDRVVPRQGLVVVEAMKMENELHSQIAGTVAEVGVEAGSTVDAGALLVRITSAVTLST